MNRLGGRAIALVVTVLLGLASLVVPPAMAADLGSIAGNVSDSNTTVAPTGQTQVQLQVLEGETWRIVANYYTDQDGDYSTDPLPAGAYRLEFSNPGYITRVSEPVNVTDGLIQQVSITLVRGATVQGRVSVPAGGPAASGWIRLYEQKGRTWPLLLEAPVQPDGTYTVGDLLYGYYKVAFGDATGHYATEYFDDVATLEEAQRLFLESGSVTTIDATLAPVVTIVDVEGQPRIAGTPRVGQRVRAKIGTLTPSSATVRYIWTLDGRRIKTATKRSLRLKAPMTGHLLGLKIVASSPGITSLGLRARSRVVRRAR